MYEALPTVQWRMMCLVSHYRCLAAQLSWVPLPTQIEHTHTLIFNILTDFLNLKYTRCGKKKNIKGNHTEEEE